MRWRATLVSMLVLFATSAFGKDIYLSIGGSANGFFTDARIFNPSFTKDITITARYLPAGGGDNSGVTPITITVAKRSMAIYDDVVKVLFPGQPALGAIRLTSDDDFVATQRIYADKRTDRQQGTLGQFVPGLDASAAKTKGVLVQLKIGQATLGNFRTNWGAVNPNSVAANVTLKLYGKDNTVLAEATQTLGAFGALAPLNVFGFFNNPSGDLTDAWVSYQSDQPILAWGSIVDNGSEDPTFVTAFEDTGVAPTTQLKTVTVHAENFFYVVTPSANLAAGDQVKFIITGDDGPHGFQLFGPTGQNLIFDVNNIVPGQTYERTITLPASGTYSFICTNSNCGTGHTSMNGTLNVGAAGNPGTGPRY